MFTLKSNNQDSVFLIIITYLYFLFYEWNAEGVIFLISCELILNPGIISTLAYIIQTWLPGLCLYMWQFETGLFHLALLHFVVTLSVALLPQNPFFHNNPPWSWCGWINAEHTSLTCLKINLELRIGKKRKGVNGSDLVMVAEKKKKSKNKGSKSDGEG